jgi:hypothetical protein
MTGHCCRLKRAAVVGRIEPFGGRDPNGSSWHLCPVDGDAAFPCRAIGQMTGNAGALLDTGKSPMIACGRGAAAARALAPAQATPHTMHYGAQTRLLVAGGFVYVVNSWLMRDSYIGAWGGLRLGAWDPPQAPRMKGGPVLHLEHTRRGVWAGPPPPNSSVPTRLEAAILIGQRESYR